MYDQNNVFAKIIRGELPSDKVVETPHALAFKDIHQPQGGIHILVVPKGPYQNVADFIAAAKDDEKADFWNCVLAAVEGAGVRDNFKMIANTGAKAEQTIPHFHIHIISHK
jgi:diadenosine tetraphosphate (Ap4A) HIT family hydrolase